MTNDKLIIRNRGFTLIELLISMSIIMLIGTIILMVFFSAIRGTEKSQKMISLRQNGNFALTQITKSLRQVNQAACSASRPEVTTVDQTEHKSTTYGCSDNTIFFQDDATLEKTEFLSPGDFTVSACNFTCETKNGYQFVTVMFELSPLPSENTGINDTYQFKNTVLLRQQP